MKRVILFPGSFSPFTDGHYALINRYLAYANDNNKKVDEVKILMSSSVRDGIDPNIVFKFVQQLYSNDNRINVSLSGKSGPVRECFEIAGNTENLGTTYVFMRSNKDHDEVAAASIKVLVKEENTI